MFLDFTWGFGLIVNGCFVKALHTKRSLTQIPHGHFPHKKIMMFLYLKEKKL